MCKENKTKSENARNIQTTLRWNPGLLVKVFCFCSTPLVCRLESYGEASMVFEFARAEAAKRARGLAHVLMCLEVCVCGMYVCVNELCT
jgi:hypothetical protein